MTAFASVGTRGRKRSAPILAIRPYSSLVSFAFFSSSAFFSFALVSKAAVSNGSKNLGFASS
jgi:hypothetical protein